MATNVWPKFTGSGWHNEGVNTISQTDYAIFFSSSSTSKGYYCLIPEEWKGKYITIGCAGLGGGRIHFRDANYNELTIIDSPTETKFLLSSTAKYIYLLTSEGNMDFYMDAVYAYLDGDSGGGDSGGTGGGTGVTQVVTLKPTSASGPSWSNTSHLYDNSTSTGAEVSATYNNYGSRVLTCNFDTSSIPSNAIITSAILEVKYKQSNSTSSRRYTPYFDINGDSSKRVLSKQLTDVSMYTETVDITNYMSLLKWITIAPYRAGISGENVLTIFDMKITVNYQIPPATKNIYLGGTKIAKITLGSTEIKKVFLGEVLLYGSSSNSSSGTSSGTWLVSAVANASYGFKLNTSGYYESQNKGVNDSVALCKVTITNPGNKNVYFDCIKSSEAKYDNAILGKVGETLSNEDKEDSDFFYSFINDGETISKTISYGAVSGDIYVKFYKDYMNAEGSDSFQFKVRIE